MQDLLGFQGAEDGLQGIIDRQQVGDGAAGRQRQDNFAFQRALRQQVEQGFQGAGKRGFIDRRCDDQPVGIFELLIQGLDRKSVV